MHKVKSSSAKTQANNNGLLWRHCHQWKQRILWLTLMLITALQSWMRLSFFDNMSWSSDIAPSSAAEFGAQYSIRANTNHQPCRVFVLAGQSNMVGRGKVAHLDELMKCGNSTESEFREAIWNGGDYKTRDDVFVHWPRQQRHGNLTVRRRDEFSHSTCFGPELMFGWAVGDAVDEPVLLIKTAWGSKSLAVDFRPPSSGQANHTKKFSPDRYGYYYSTMIEDIRMTLGNITNFVPNYDSEAGYSIEGLVWFQGWDDHGMQEFVDEYEHNLRNLIHDVRLDLGLPGLPFVIGELGMHGLDLENRTGPDERKRVLGLRAAQKRVTQLDEFKSNTLFIRTAPYAVFGREKYNAIYHYNGRADAYLHIGRAFGNGMLQLLERRLGTSSLRYQ